MSQRDQERVVPVSLCVVAVLHLLLGLSAVMEVITGLFRNHISVNLAVLCIPACVGLLAFRNGWRWFAMVTAWVGVVGCAVMTVAFVTIDAPTSVSVVGYRFAYAPAWFSALFAAAIGLVCLWQFRVLTRPRIRALFFDRQARGRAGWAVMHERATNIALGSTLVCAIAAIGAGYGLRDVNFEPWQQLELPHPAGQPTVTFMQRKLGPRSPGCEYMIRFVDGESSVERAPLVNARDDGTFFDFFWHPAEGGVGPWIRMQHAWEDQVYLLDLGQRSLRLVYPDEGRLLAAEILEPWGPVVGRERGAWSENEWRDEERAVDLSEHPAALSAGQSLGRISGYGRLKLVEISEEERQRQEQRAWHRREMGSDR